MTNDPTKPSIVPPAVDMTRAPQTPSSSGVKQGRYAKQQKGFTFYKLHTKGEVVPNHYNYTITKFDQDLNVESSYNMTYIPSNNGGYYDCNCPAAKFDCRHKSIQRTILQAGKQDSDKFYCFETGTFKMAEEI